MLKTLSETLGVVRELGVCHHPRPGKPEESKTSASSSTAVILSRQSSDKTKQVEAIEADDIDRLSNDLKLVIISYLIDLKRLNDQGQIPPRLPRGANSFLAILTEYYTWLTRHIAHNLLWHLDLDETLSLAKTHEACFYQVVQEKDPCDRLVEGTILQIMKAMGNRNTRKMKKEEKPFGMVESIFRLFEDNPEMVALLKAQFDAWPLDEKASAETMKPYEAAIAPFFQKIINDEGKEIPSDDKVLDDAACEKLLNLSACNDFEKAFKPRPEHVVRSGFIFDIRLFFKFLEIRKKYIESGQLKRYSDKDKLLLVKFDLIFQSMLPRCDLEILNKGMWHVETGQIPDHIDFSKGGPAAEGLGRHFSFGSYGDKVRAAYGDAQTRIIGVVGLFTIFQNLCQAKTATVDLRNTR